MYPIMELTTKINLKKKRVVFDRSVQFQGKSINGEPVLEMYLTNQILSVLLKFQQQEATDIEAMFYQIKNTTPSKKLFEIPLVERWSPS